MDPLAGPGDVKPIYGWTNESYLRAWRHSDWAIHEPLFIIRPRVTTADREFVRCHKVDATAGYTEVELEELDQEFYYLYGA